jgi:hypothetical protein
MVAKKKTLPERRQVTAIRLPPSIKIAVAEAAAADRRSASSYIEGLIVDDLKKKGLIK